MANINNHVICWQFLNSAGLKLFFYDICTIYMRATFTFLFPTFYISFEYNMPQCSLPTSGGCAVEMERKREKRGSQQHKKKILFILQIYIYNLHQKKKKKRKIRVGFYMKT
jgi:hypothetical protein